MENENFNTEETANSDLGAVMPRLIEIGDFQIEQPDAVGDWEVIIKDNDLGEVYCYLTNAQVKKLVDFVLHFLNKA